MPILTGLQNNISHKCKPSIYHLPRLAAPPSGAGERRNMNSREKGKKGERELAGILKAHGYKARRGQQYCGTSGEADVIGIPGVHIECKRAEALNLYTAMAQAVRDAVDAAYDEMVQRFTRRVPGRHCRGASRWCGRGRSVGRAFRSRGTRTSGRGL